MRTLLLHNPKAGAGGHTEKELLAALKVGGMRSSYCSTKSAEFPDILTKKVDQYVVAGGDGTIAKVLTKLPDRSRPVAIVPLGTANNIARSFGVAGTPQELAERFTAESLRRLDIGRVTGPWEDAAFVEAVGIGTLAAAMAHKSASDRPSGSRKIIRGRETLVRTLKAQKAFDMEIELDGSARHGRFLAVEILNTPSSGPALPLAPGADPGDGWFDVLLVGEDDRAAFTAWLESPQHESPDFGKTIRARRIEFIWNGEPLRIDDELPDKVEEPAKVVITVQPVPVQVMMLTETSPTRSEERDAETVA